jgi:beta-glucosidase
MSESAFSEAARRVANGSDPHVEARALVAMLTLDEKLGCLDGDLPFWPGLADLTSGGYVTHPFPAAVVQRLGIPGIQFSDGPRGCVCGPATAFPVSMARGASFDPLLERRIGQAIGTELRAVGATYTGAVCMNLLRHPAWGRAQETYGEDPLHVGLMAEALTVGLQVHVMACMKHFALNSMENARFTVDVTVSDRALHEVYLPHFKRVADAGVASVMSSYNSVNGEWCGENATLLIEILRKEWGWDGFVTSDFVFGLRDPVKSVQAGLNIEMPFMQQRALALHAAIADHSLTLDTVELRVEETLATLLRFDRLFTASPSPSLDVLANESHRALAHEASVASMVLLRNEANLLPVDSSAVRRVAVLGRLAAVANLGDGGSSNVHPPSVSTPLDGIRAALPSAVVVHADSGVSVVGDADLVVVVVGYTKLDEGEWLDQSATAALAGLFPPMDHPTLGVGVGTVGVDAVGAGTDTTGQRRRVEHQSAEGFDLGFAKGGDRASLRLSAADEALIEAVASASNRVVVVVMGGSAIVMPWLDRVSAALMIWYPGMEGGRALADVLFGRNEPGGRLPFAVPFAESDLVHFDRDATSETYDLLHGQWWLDHNNVPAQLPFGFGLGYTEILVERVALHGSDVVATVHNIGHRDGTTVVQVYASVADDGLLRPANRLVGFQKVAVPSGDVVNIAVPLDWSALHARINGAMVPPSTTVTLRVGQHAGDPQAIFLSTTAPDKVR